MEALRVRTTACNELANLTKSEQKAKREHRTPNTRHKLFSASASRIISSATRRSIKFSLGRFALFPENQASHVIHASNLFAISIPVDGAQKRGL